MGVEDVTASVLPVKTVIPAKAGIQSVNTGLDSRFRGDDDLCGIDDLECVLLNDGD